jgi:hypothetical protein
VSYEMRSISAWIALLGEAWIDLRRASSSAVTRIAIVLRGGLCALLRDPFGRGMSVPHSVAGALGVVVFSVCAVHSKLSHCTLTKCSHPQASQPIFDPLRLCSSRI